jgi:hypothetical protein
MIVETGATTTTMTETMTGTMTRTMTVDPDGIGARNMTIPIPKK